MNLILLCSFFLGVSGEPLQNLWRFVDYPSHGQDLISYKDKVTVEIMRNFTWISPTCIDFRVNSIYQFLCSKPGFHFFDLQENENSFSNESAGIIIPLDNTADCYKWKTAYEELKEYSHAILNSKVLLNVWAGEMASKETTKDLYTTALFWSLGEVPSVTVLHPSEATVTELGFNSSHSCWQFHITLELTPITYEILLKISGRKIFAVDCSIRPLMSLISFEKFIDHTLEILPLMNSSIDHFPVLYQDKQTLGIALITYNGQNVITKDNFKTHTVFEIKNISGVLDDVDFTTAAMCVVVDGEVFIVAASTSIVAKASGLPFSGVEHLSARGTVFLPGVYLNDLVAAWSSPFYNTEEDNIYISQDGGQNFQNITLPLGSAQSVAIHPNCDEVFVLVSLDNDMVQVILYDVLAQQWSLNSFGFNTNGGNVTIKFFPSGFGDLLIWEETAVYYSANKGVTVNQIPVYTVIDTVFAIVSWKVDHIKQVSLGRNGQFVIRSNENRLFFGNVVFGYALEISYGVPVDIHFFLMFNSLGEVLLIPYNGSISEVYKIPTYSLVLSALYPPPVCPFIRWSHNVRKSIYYLDSMANLLFWITVTPRIGQTNHLSFAISHESNINLFVTEVVDETIVEGVAKRNLSIRIQPNLNMTHLNKMTAIRLSLVGQNYGCQSPAQTVALVSVQCPPTRHIRVKRAVNHCPEFDDHTYRIPRNAYDPGLKGRPNVNGNVDKIVQYNKSQWGCPIKVPYMDTFKPILELYDRDEYITDVGADYVVWEVHGRKDFRYTSTAQQVGCHSANQLWSDMLQGGDHPSAAWTPLNYRSCFQEGGGVLSGSAPYQILNLTGASSLSWYGHNGIFVFTARVIANDYSYCDLTATFAVEVYGATDVTYIGYIFLVLTCVVGVMVLVASFFYYRYLLKSINHDKSD